MVSEARLTLTVMIQDNNTMIGIMITGLFPLPSGMYTG
jgi:hypothetical protein